MEAIQPGRLLRRNRAADAESTRIARFGAGFRVEGAIDSAREGGVHYVRFSVGVLETGTRVRFSENGLRHEC